MKQPCIGYTPQARRIRDGLGLDVRTKIIRVFGSMFSELWQQAEASANQLCRLAITDGCVLLYRLPTSGEYTNCCKLKAALVVDHFELQ